MDLVFRCWLGLSAIEIHFWGFLKIRFEVGFELEKIKCNFRDFAINHVSLEEIFSLDFGQVFVGEK